MTVHQQQPTEAAKAPASRSQATQQLDQDLAKAQQAHTALSPERAAPGEILALQRAVGNRAVSGLIQAKLHVGPVGDVYEQEADRVAEKVMRAPALDSVSSVQRQGAPEEEELQMKPLAATITPVVQRQEDEEELQMKPLTATNTPVVQRQEDEEELQMKPLSATNTPVVQRQEDEEELQMKPLSATNTPVVQRQEDEEELQMKPLTATNTPVVQRQEDEEELQTKPLAATTTPTVQRQEDEEELQMKPLSATNTPVVQRQEDEEELQMKPLAATTTPTVQRQEDEEELQMKPLGGGGFQASDDIERQLRLRRGGGSPLSANLRAEMEARFGVSFDAVRLHKDGEAGQLNEDLRARAFTHGTDIYLGASQPDITTGEGKRLLAHELTHVVQQTGGKPRSGTTTQPVQSPTGNTVQRFWGKKKSPYKLADAPTNPDEYMEYLKNNPDKLSDKERELIGIRPSVSKDPVGYVKFLARNQERLMSKKERGLFQMLARQSQPTQEEDPYHDPLHPTMSPLVNKRPPDNPSQTEEDPYHDPFHPSMSPLVNKRPPDNPPQTEEDPYHDPFHPSMSPLVNKRPPDSSSTPTPATPSKWERFKGRFSPGMKRRLLPDLSVPASLRKQGAGTTGGLLQGPGVSDRPALSARPESEGGRTWQQGFDDPEKKEKGDTDIDKKIEKLEAQLEILKQLKGGD